MTPQTKPKFLKDIRIDKISFVSRPANLRDFLFFKSEDKNAMSLQEAIEEKAEELSKSADPEEELEESIETLSKYYDDLSTEAQDAVATLGVQIDKEEDSLDEEDVRKALREELEDQDFLVSDDLEDLNKSEDDDEFDVDDLSEEEVEMVKEEKDLFDAEEVKEIARDATEKAYEGETE